MESTWFEDYIKKGLAEYQGQPKLPQFPYQYPNLELSSTYAAADNGQDVYRLMVIHHLTGQENNPSRVYGNGGHSLFVHAIDEDGSRIDGLGFRAHSVWIDDDRKKKNEAPGYTDKGVVPMDKGRNEPAGNIPVWGNERIDFCIDDGKGTTSDWGHNIQTVWPDDDAGQNTIAHHSFLAVFVKTQAGKFVGLPQSSAAPVQTMPQGDIDQQPTNSGALIALGNGVFIDPLGKAAAYIASKYLEAKGK